MATLFLVWLTVYPSVCASYVTKQCTKAMVFLIKKFKLLHLSIEVKINLCNRIVTPVYIYIYVYGCEIWGYVNSYCIERIQAEVLEGYLGL